MPEGVEMIDARDPASTSPDELKDLSSLGIVEKSERHKGEVAATNADGAGRRR